MSEETLNCQHHCAGAHELAVESASAAYDKVRVLEDVDFRVKCGSRLALLGPNGAGKSTLIRLLAGLMKPVSGSLLWRGEKLTQSTREIAYLPQIDQHQPHFPISVREVVEMGRFPHIGHFGRFSPKDREHVDAALESMKMTNLADRQIDELSGGQQQRAFIARALAQEAHVILLDEPFNGLDVESRCHLGETLADLAKTGHLVIASHHNIENTAELFDLALVVAREQIAFGPVNEVLSDSAVQNLLHSCHPSLTTT